MKTITKSKTSTKQKVMVALGAVLIIAAAGAFLMGTRERYNYYKNKLIKPSGQATEQPAEEKEMLPAYDKTKWKAKRTKTGGTISVEEKKTGNN